MAHPRRIVPDTSVLVGGMFPSDERFPLKRAIQLINAIATRSVICFAPDALVIELVKVAFDKRSGKRSSNANADEVDDQLTSFLKLPIEYIPSETLVTQAIEHCRHNSISPTDAWFLAAAETYGAELWISHDQRDGFASNARRTYGTDNLFTLEKHDFHKVGKTKH
jgi:predicted nucleic acid-binding protein